jgi:hypothetical protein
MANELGWFSQIVQTAPTLVQSKWNSTGTSSASVVLTNVAAGNLIIVVATAVGPTSLTNGDVTDGVAGYTLDKSTALVSSSLIGSWSRVAASTGSITITAAPATGGASAATNICAYEVSGLGSKAFDAGNSNNGSGTSTSSSTFNRASAGIVVAMECDLTGNTISHTATNSYSISDSGNAHRDDNTGANIAGAAQHKTFSASGSNENATMTLGQSESWNMLAAGYK